MRRWPILLVALVLLAVSLADSALARGRRLRAGSEAQPWANTWQGEWAGPWAGPYGGLWAGAWAGQYAVHDAGQAQGAAGPAAAYPAAGYPYPGYAYTVGLRGAHGSDLTGWSGWYGAWGPRWLPPGTAKHGAW